MTFLSKLKLSLVMALLIISPVLGLGMDDSFIKFNGLDRSNPTQLKPEISFTQCDNYVLGFKAEENPLFTSLSVRPEITAYLNDPGEAVRGLFHYQVSGGDNVLLMANTDTIFKSGGTAWTTLETGLSDNPWEGVLYADPDVTRMYMCNGVNENKKYLSGKDDLYDMQDQDSETATAGTVYFTNDSVTATVDATALAALEAGRYIKSATTADDTEWVEITTIESSTLTFSRAYPGSTSAETTAVRSNNVSNSRHMLEYEGFMVLGAVGASETSLVSNTVASTYYILDGAYGVAQSFEASSYFNTIELSIWRGSGTTGNIILKLKSAIDSTDTVALINQPVSGLLGAVSTVAFDFGKVDAGVYYLTVERETSSTSPVYISRGSALADGNAFWTYNSGGFVSGWDTGVTTVAGTVTDTYVSSSSPNDNQSSNTSLSLATAMGGTVYYRALMESVDLHNKRVKSDVYNFTATKLSVSFTGGFSNKDFTFARVLVDNDISVATWNNRLSGTSWNTAGCLGSGTDFTATNAVVVNNGTLPSRKTADITNMAGDWAVSGSDHYGVVVSVESTAAGSYSIASSNASSNAPSWEGTTITGSTEASQDIYIKVVQDAISKATFNYSKRFKPENFPTLNTIDIPGSIVGLAKTGGYLVVAGKDPDAMYFYNFTGSTADGEGIKFVTSISDVTFGSSKSIVIPPKKNSFIFFSGSSVFEQLGTQYSPALSDRIQEEAKLFSNYRDPEDYYGGFADLMPQAVILPTKNSYLLSVPNTESENSYIYVFNYELGAWTRWTDLNATSMLVRKLGGAEPTLYLGMQDGQVYTLDTTGSTTHEAVLEWYFNKGDLTRDKQISFLEFWGRKDNPLTNCYVTLEVDGVDTGLDKSYSKSVSDNTTTDAMEEVKFSIGKTAKEFKLKLTQQASAGAISWRSFRYNYDVKKTR